MKGKGRGSVRDGWVCGRCNRQLEQGKTQVRYLGKMFTVEVLRCPSCGMVMITEEIATGKIAEAEQLLEDK
jgi:predicted RNA-binding Zn-ribbon protein involved in translation (DUF1610 family)